MNTACGQGPSSADYFPSGETLRGEHGRRVSRGFTGHGHLDRTGLVHMNGRVHDPRLGRFPSPDPIVADPTSSQSWNLHGHVGNNPPSRVDPTGLVVAGRCSDPREQRMNFGGGDGGGGYSTRSLTVPTTHYVYGTFGVTTTFWVPDEVEVWDPHLDMWVTVDQGGYQSETHTHSYVYPVTAARTVQVPVDDGLADEPADWRAWRLRRPTWAGRFSFRATTWCAATSRSASGPTGLGEEWKSSRPQPASGTSPALS